jgi:DNA polymerase elongation subunit (family B)
MSYRNIYYNGKEHEIVLFTWDKDGKRVQLKVTHDPYIYLENVKGEAESIYGTKLTKKIFRNQYERYKFLKESEIKRVFENLNITQQYLVDTFWQNNETPEFSKHPIKILFLDIEVHAPDEFPKPTEAKQPVNVITVYDNITNKYHTWGCGKYTPEENDVVYYNCKTEKEILIKFLEYLEKDYPDVLSGWNSEFFDIPYLINRITNLLGEEYARRLSPVNSIYYRTIPNQFGQETIRWHIDGVSLIDYLDVYKRFCLGERESYKLNSIAEAELGEKKIDFGVMNLATLADNDWQTFVKYNIQDVRLVSKLENKLKYLELIRMLAYVGLTSFEGAMGTLSVINGATAIRARYRGQKIPTFIRNEDDGKKNPGAYVGEPLSGFQQYIVSFDANSLYPNVMISLNISPETKVGGITHRENGKVFIKTTNGKVHELTEDNFQLFVQQKKIAISKANILFTQVKKGIMPEILDYYYNQRQEIKKDLKKYKKQYAEKSDKNVKMKIDQLDAKQLCIKVFINSIYGYFGNKNASFGDDDIASSITLTGQAVIKQSNELLKEFLKQKTNIADEVILNKNIIYNDTDSSYVSIKPLIENNIVTFNDGKKLTEETYNVVQEIEDYLNKKIKIWGSKELNSNDCRFNFKREAIADVGIFLQKKRYVMHVMDDEGIPCDKFKYTGVEVVRSTMPSAIKPHVKRIIETMLMSRNVNDTNKVVNEIYDIFKNLPVEDITFVSNINGYEEYASKCDEFKTCKGMPAHVKAAYYYNLLLDRFGVSNKYEKIGSGDKVRHFYVKQPNSYKINGIAYKYYYPEEFKSKFEPDYNLMFEKHIFSVVDRFYKNVNWTAQKPGSQVQTDLFSLLS